MRDEYQAVGEMHDLFMTEPWERLTPALASAFAALGPEAVILDLGAGSGIGTRLLARTTPAQILAVEPSLTMRTTLLARIADDADLSARVSVLAGSAPAIFNDAPGPFDGFVCAHMLGHLSTSERAATLRELALRLTPAGVGLVTLPPTEEITLALDAELIEQRRIGSHVYRARHTIDRESGRPREEYAVLDGDRVLRSTTAMSAWSLPPRTEFLAELEAAGLTLENIEAGAGIVRPHSAAT